YRIESELEIDQGKHIGIFKPSAAGRLEQCRFFQPIVELTIGLTQGRFAGHRFNRLAQRAALLDGEVNVVLNTDLGLKLTNDLRYALAYRQPAMLAIDLVDEPRRNEAMRDPDVFGNKSLTLDVRRVAIKLFEKIRGSLALNAFAHRRVSLFEQRACLLEEALELILSFQQLIDQILHTDLGHRFI